MSFLLYSHKDSSIHNLDPRTKMIWIFVLSTLVFLANNPIIIVGILLLILFIAFIAKLSFLNIWNNTKSFVLILPVIYIALFSLSLDSVHQGVYQGILFTIKFWVLIFSAIVLNMTTSARDFLLGLIKLGVPFEFAFMVTLSIRFVPLITQEIIMVTSAQKARAYEISWKFSRPIESLRQIKPVIIPVITLLLKRSYEMVIAMESRGYNPKKRIFPKRIRMRWKDWVLVTLSIISIYLVWFYKL